MIALVDKRAGSQEVSALRTQIEILSKNSSERLQATQVDFQERMNEVQTKSSTEIESFVSRLETLIMKLGSALQRSEDSTKVALSELAKSGEDKHSQVQEKLSDFIGSTDENIGALKSQ